MAGLPDAGEVIAPAQILSTRKPPWLKVRAPGGPKYLRVNRLLHDLKLHTICEEAHCPNIGECWEQLTATFLILGDTCTRNCGFCAVTHGKPSELDLAEPERVAQAIRVLGLEHAVITSVNRDDQADGGSDLCRGDSPGAGAVAGMQRRGSHPGLPG